MEEKRNPLATIRLLAFNFLRRIKRTIERVLQLVYRDQLLDLRRETERLSAASVESVTYLGADVHRIEERLASLEAEIASLRRLLEERAEAELAKPPDRV